MVPNEYDPATGRFEATHGASRGGPLWPTYRSWASMISRCKYPCVRGYHNYGGRGISVHPEWARSFESFLTDMGPRPVGTTLDRIDGDKNYEPGNARWADKYEQARNKRTSKLTEVDVRFIRHWASAGYTQREIAAAFMVDQSHVSRTVRANRSWANIGQG